MKHTTTDGGVGSGDGRGESDLRGCRSVLKILRVKDGLNILPRVSVLRACEAASRGVVRRGGWPAPHRWSCALRTRVAEVSAPPTPRRRGRVVADLGGARALVLVYAARKRRAVQPKSRSYGGERSE